MRAVVGARLIQRLIPILELHRTKGATRPDLEDFLGTVTATTPKMVKRRLSTIVGWLTQIDLIEDRGGRFFLKQLAGGVEVVDYPALGEPLLPQTHEWNEYRNVSTKLRQEMRTITVLIDEATRERASQAHDMLTKLVAGKIRTAGGIPKQNKLIDLAARVGDKDYIFEMKSTTQRNFHSQVRAAISQLYEYRYLYSMPNSNLVVVIENPPPDDRRWMLDYVIK